MIVFVPWLLIDADEALLEISDDASADNDADGGAVTLVEDADNVTDDDVETDAAWTAATDDGLE